MDILQQIEWVQRAIWCGNNDDIDIWLRQTQWSSEWAEYLNSNWKTKCQLVLNLPDELLTELFITIVFLLDLVGLVLDLHVQVVLELFFREDAAALGLGD